MADPFSGLALLTDGLALAVGGATTYFDCFQTMTTRVGRVPETFRTNPFVLALSATCGVFAAVACDVSGRHPESVLSTILTLRTDDPWRGAVVGASVLVLIRSKLFNIANSPVGGEYLYELGRDAAINDANRRYTIRRSNFLNRNEGAALIAGAGFEPAIIDLVSATISARPATVQTLFSGKLDTIVGNRPPGAFDAMDSDWVTYYRSLIGLALDACGPSVVASLHGFT